MPLLHHPACRTALALLALALGAPSQTPVQTSYLKPSNTETGDTFGHSVALSGDTLVVGAPNEDSAATGVNGNQADNAASNSGAAFVLVRSGGSWVQQAYLKAPDVDVTDLFGYPVAISGDTIAVGEPNEDSAATGVDGNWASEAAMNSGAACVFVRSGGTWTQQAYLKASNTEATDQFGWSIAADGDTVVVGAPYEDSATTGVNGDQSNNGASNAGAVYVFVRSGGAWTQQAYLKASNAEAFDGFGGKVSISGDTLVVGALSEDGGATGVNGDQASNTKALSGAAYVFVRSGGVWTQEAYLKASNTGSGDEFGWDVSVSGDTLVVGAAWETSNAKGVNGNQANNSMNGAGAAYVFVRNGTTWSQQAYLKASNTNVEATFGWTVTASGDRVVVGAPEEKSAGTGVNGNQADTSASGAGAAYVFRRSGSTWKQQAYLKAANNEAGDNFGLDVGLDGDTLLVGAPLEDSSALGVNGDQSDNGAPAAGAVEVFDLYPGPWTGVGPGLAGVAGTPFLYGEGELAGGDAVTLKLTGAKPLGSATLVIGFSLLAAPFKAGTMVPYPDLLFFGLPTDANGALSLPSTWPTGLPSGVSLWFQDWVADGAGAKGFSASNGLVGTTP